MARTLRRPLRMLGTALVLLVALGTPAAALAATGGGEGILPRQSDPVLVDVVDVTLDNKLMATIQYQVTCREFRYYDWELGEYVTTTAGRLFANGALLQAQGRSIASASGFGRADVTCDGATVNHLSVQVLADVLPLKRGSAVVGVSVDIGAGETEDFGASGPTAVRLR